MLESEEKINMLYFITRNKNKFEKAQIVLGDNKKIFRSEFQPFLIFFIKKYRILLLSVNF